VDLTQINAVPTEAATTASAWLSVDAPDTWLALVQRFVVEVLMNTLAIDKPQITVRSDPYGRPNSELRAARGLLWGIVGGGALWCLIGLAAWCLLR
jgi:hypothetical protein